jgi:hypothetical protein
LIDNITHAFEVFRTLNIVLKDTPIMERPNSQLFHLVELVDTISEQHVDDLVACVQHVVLGD